MFQTASATPVKPARMVILGSSGFVGRHLLELCKERGVEALGFGSKDLDLAAPDAAAKLSAIFRKDDTLVFASCITRDKGDDLPTFVKNMKMAEAVGVALEKAPVARVLYLSSDAVYKDGISPVREDSECKPVGLYPMAQFAREGMLTHAAAKAKVPLALLRLCAVYGKGDTHNGYGPNRFLKLTRQPGGKITLGGEGEETRDHLFVGDAARLILLCAEHQGSGVLNLVSGKAVSFMECAQAVAKAVPGTQIETTPRKSPVTHRQFDHALLLRTFPSFKPTGLEEGVGKSL